jgi:hypothetical protein
VIERAETSVALELEESWYVNGCGTNVAGGDGGGDDGSCW